MHLKRDCGVVHAFVFERKAGQPWVETLIEKSMQHKFFSWNCIVFYRKNKKGLAEQPVTPEEVLQNMEELESRDKAIHVLSHLLHSDMAYDAELMQPEEAEILATAFIAFFGDDCRYYSNSSWEEGTGLRTWSDFTDATFDSGVIAVDTKQIGIAWFEDED